LLPRAVLSFFVNLIASVSYFGRIVANGSCQVLSPPAPRGCQRVHSDRVISPGPIKARRGSDRGEQLLPPLPHYASVLRSANPAISPCPCPGTRALRAASPPSRPGALLRRRRTGPAGIAPLDQPPRGPFDQSGLAAFASRPPPRPRVLLTSGQTTCA
jgi:hypothetical protein